jgi:hypothetical protein
MKDLSLYDKTLHIVYNNFYRSTSLNLYTNFEIQKFDHIDSIDNIDFFYKNIDYKNFDYKKILIEFYNKFNNNIIKFNNDINIDSLTFENLLIYSNNNNDSNKSILNDNKNIMKNKLMLMDINEFIYRYINIYNLLNRYNIIHPDKDNIINSYNVNSIILNMDMNYIINEII